MLFYALGASKGPFIYLLTKTELVSDGKAVE